MRAPFDEETRQIAIKPVEKELPHSYKLRRSGEVKTQAEINSASFMKFFKIPLPVKTIPFSCE